MRTNNVRTLYAFGDSFTLNFDEEWTWIRALGKKLNVNALHNSSANGVSNDWILLQLRKQLDNITKDDVVVVILTDPSRSWLLEKYPEYSNYSVANLDELLTEEEASSIKNYVLNIQRDNIDIFRFEHQLAWLKQIQKTIGFNLLVIPGFPLSIDYTGLIEVVGDLSSSVSSAEFMNDCYWDWYAQGIDTRYNHMIRDNHAILVDKCVKSLLTNQPLNLAVGFKRSILKVTDRYTHKQLGPMLIIQAKQLSEKSNRSSDSPSWLDK